ncbi:hypothetical protein ACIPY0_00215 [Paenarthrobacter nicotinovorans]|uniref:hypothetical protein n=1 Tax=Paenarthrobacter nicotinovorans TaxID=29320 RepID=UPI003823A9CD
MQTITELIESERTASGLSYRDLAARAIAAGYSLKFQYLNDLATTGPKSWPKNPDTIRALAVALRTSEKSVILAYARALGLEVRDSESPLANRLPAGTELLSPPMQDALIKLISAAIGEERGGNADSTAPMNQAGESPAKRHLVAVEDQDDNLPLPDNWRDLAADTSHTRHVERDKEWADIGEESQDNDED